MVCVVMGDTVVRQKLRISAQDILCHYNYFFFLSWKEPFRRIFKGGID